MLNPGPHFRSGLPTAVPHVLIPRFWICRSLSLTQPRPSSLIQPNTPSSPTQAALSSQPQTSPATQPNPIPTSSIQPSIGQPPSQLNPPCPAPPSLAPLAPPASGGIVPQPPRASREIVVEHSPLSQKGMARPSSIPRLFLEPSSLEHCESSAAPSDLARKNAPSTSSSFGKDVIAPTISGAGCLDAGPLVAFLVPLPNRSPWARLFPRQPHRGLRTGLQPFSPVQHFAPPKGLRARLHIPARPRLRCPQQVNIRSISSLKPPRFRALATHLFLK